MTSVAYCFCIGRLKGPEYVSVTTKAYRQAVDTAWSAMEEVMTSETVLKSEMDSAVLHAGKEAVQLTDKMRWDLEQVLRLGAVQICCEPELFLMLQAYVVCCRTSPHHHLRLLSVMAVMSLIMIAEAIFKGPCSCRCFLVAKMVSTGV
jgi:hypothetical protein